MDQPKTYDRAYFDAWYRRQGINRGAILTRKVAMAVATAEFHLMRPLRSVLDVGCGEGVWRAPLLALRPKLAYLGLDNSDYAVDRFGRRRNLHRARFGDLEHLRFDRAFDLLVCADVLHYLGDAEVRRGLSGFAALCHGVAYLETYCAEDEIDGDLHGFRRRPAAWYRHEFAKAGFVACGSHLWLSPVLADEAAALEIQAPSPRARSRTGAST
ncbi:class I SAM-dependent DNA methyltransferase [Pseudofulvimonas gallinarii]|jgi:SAM-dependent methyltransferase|uniref:Methyltransferase family protein n=1 Tax=Pseudofulvimonas gallinarii TaxID=634155 RepID=A0A4R3LLR6_9GAMM|nr:class I SAM-dependent methyltransferase [Pseudofulvimonas gallinarii]TCT01184.1 methyltransferase family protein [Pseudofulvimonas gallinarii]THD14952.1 methyltransferase [Pseudofulvimonas gallinarii]